MNFNLAIKEAQEVARLALPNDSSRVVRFARTIGELVVLVEVTRKAAANFEANLAAMKTDFNEYTGRMAQEMLELRRRLEACERRHGVKPKGR